MDLVLLKDIVIGAAAVLAAGLAWWNWLQSPSKANADAIKAMVEKLTEHDRRIQTIEGEMKHLPDKDAVTDLKVAIVELRGTVKAMDVQLAAVGRTVANIDGYLRKDGEN